MSMVPGFEEARIGPGTSVFEVRQGRLIGGIGFTLYCCGMASFIIAGAFFVPIRPNVNPIAHHALFLGAGSAFLCLSACLLISIRRRIGLRVALHDGGLAIRRGDRVSILPWEDVRAVYHKEKTHAAGFADSLGSILDGSQNTYTLIGPGGERFVLDSYLRDIEILGAAIRRGTFPRLFQESLKTYRVEGHVAFGKLGVGRDGLTKGEKLLPWGRVGFAVVENGLVFVKKTSGRNAWSGVGVGKVPNLAIYLALIAGARPADSSAVSIRPEGEVA